MVLRIFSLNHTFANIISSLNQEKDLNFINLLSELTTGISLLFCKSLTKIVELPSSKFAKRAILFPLGETDTLLIRGGLPNISVSILFSLKETSTKNKNINGKNNDINFFKVILKAPNFLVIQNCYESLVEFVEVL